MLSLLRRLRRWLRPTPAEILAEMVAERDEWMRTARGDMTYEQTRTIRGTTYTVSSEVKERRA